MTVVLPVMNESQTQAWRALLAVQREIPDGWCLVGGQLVHLHCSERGVAPNRPTNDGDAVLDIRSRPEILNEFTAALGNLGFAADGTSMEGHQHRWVNGEASIDLLIPRGVGERAGSRRGASGGTTLESPGAQQALERAELVQVQVGTDIGFVPRPDLLGALVSKAAAHSIPNDSRRERHLLDFAVLASLISRNDSIAARLTARDRHHLVSMLKAMDRSRSRWLGIADAERGVDVLRTLLGAPRSTPTRHKDPMPHPLDAASPGGWTRGTSTVDHQVPGGGRCGATKAELPQRGEQPQR